MSSYRLATIILCLACSIPVTSCAPLRQVQHEDVFDSGSLAKEEDPEGVQCLRYLRTLRPNIVAARLKQISDIRDSDVIGTLLCAAPGSVDVMLSYRATDESWNSRHAVPRSGYLEFLKTRPTMYGCLQYMAESLGITPYYHRANGVWHIFLFDSISGEVPEDLLPLDAKPLPFQ